MAKIRITREFSFEMAHALWNYDGWCRNIHGHSYILFVTVIGEPISDPGNPKNGMVMDFGVLKEIVQEEIILKMDHALVLSSVVPNYEVKKLEQMFERRAFVDYQPTCENMIQDFAQRIQARLPEEIQLYSLRLHETAKSYVEWFASDNL